MIFEEKARARNLKAWSTASLILTALLLSACASDTRSSRSTRSSRPATPPANGVHSAQFRQCAAKLNSLGARYTPLPDRDFGGGCTSYGAVRLDRITVPTTNLGPMTCPLAQNFAAWVRYGVQPAARVYFGTEVVRIDTFGTYNCRRIAGSSRLSQHAKADAVDVAAFLLADGRRISVQSNWNGDDASRRFLRRIRESACKRFNTVLSPDYNAAHHDHFHFDMGGRGGFCR